jgi:hypothetical protein
MSTWSQLRGMDSFGRGLDGGGYSNAGLDLSNLIDMKAIADFNTGTSGNLISSIGSTDMTKGPMGFGDYMGNVGDLFKGFTGTPASAGKPATTGWGMPVISAAQGLMSGYLGMKNYGLAKDQFKFSKEMANKNLANQTKEFNGQLEDRQRARVASNPGAYQSVDAYMKEKGI